MKYNYQLVFFLLISSIWEVSASTVLTSLEGENFTFGEWTQPEVVSVNSSFGPTTLTRRSCSLSVEFQKSVYFKTVDMLINGSKTEIYLGDRSDEYSVVGQKIWALTPSLRVLVIRQSQTVDNGTNTEEAILQRAIDRYVGNNTLNDNKYVDLCRVFGADVIMTGSHSSSPTFSLVSNSVNAAGITIAMKTTKNDNLSVTISPDFEVLSGTMNGKGIYILNSGTSIDEVVPVNGTQIKTSHGTARALWAIRDYYTPDVDPATGTIGILARAKIFVSTDTGNVWAGPSGCEVVELNGNWVGVALDGTSKQLQIFSTVRAQVPLSPDSVNAFNKIVTDFDTEFKANQYKCKPDLTFNLTDLFPDNTRSEGEYRLREALISNTTNLAVRINCPVPVYPEITFSPDLKIVGTRIIESGSPDLITHTNTFLLRN